MDAAFWKTVHDGTVDAIDGQLPGDLTLAVGIAYLCKMLPTSGATLRATLTGCRRFIFTPFGEAPITDLQAIADLKVDMSYASEHGDHIGIACVTGELEIAYGSLEIRTVEGHLVTQAELSDAASRYWTEWEARNAENRLKKQ